MDELLVRIEATPDVYADGEMAQDALKNKAEHELIRALGVRTKVQIVPMDSIPRTDFKARRVIDDRDLFTTLNQELGD